MFHEHDKDGRRIRELPFEERADLFSKLVINKASGHAFGSEAMFTTLAEKLVVLYQTHDKKLIATLLEETLQIKTQIAKSHPRHIEEVFYINRAELFFFSPEIEKLCNEPVNV